jgi:hypothetical protein
MYAREAHLTRLAWEGVQESHVDPAVRPDFAGSHPIQYVSYLWARWDSRKAVAHVYPSPTDRPGSQPSLPSSATLEAWSGAAGYVCVMRPGVRLHVQPQDRTASLSEESGDPEWDPMGRELGVLVERDGLPSAGQEVTCRSDTVDGRACRRLTFERSYAPNAPANQRSIWVCPGLGYAVVREEERLTYQALVVRKSRTGFRRYTTQAGDDVWLPLQVSFVTYASDPENRGRRMSWGALNVRRYRLDIGPDDEFLGLTLDDLPAGYAIHDSRAGVGYRRGTPVDQDDPVVREGAEQLCAFARDPDPSRLLREWKRHGGSSRHPGPQALLMLCAMRGVSASTSELARLAGAGVRGTSMSGLLAAARAKGFEASVQSVAVKDLGPANLPAIFEVRPNYYLVVVGVADDHVVTVTPPQGLKVTPIRFWPDQRPPSVTLLILGKGPPGSHEVRWGSRWVASLQRLPIIRRPVWGCVAVAIVAASTALLLALRRRSLRSRRAPSEPKPAEANGPEPGA